MNRYDRSINQQPGYFVWINNLKTCKIRMSRKVHSSSGWQLAVWLTWLAQAWASWGSWGSWPERLGNFISEMPEHHVISHDVVFWYFLVSSRKRNSPERHQADALTVYVIGCIMWWLSPSVLFRFGKCMCLHGKPRHPIVTLAVYQPFFGDPRLDFLGSTQVIWLGHGSSKRERHTMK